MCNYYCYHAQITWNQSWRALWFNHLLCMFGCHSKKYLKSKIWKNQKMMSTLTTVPLRVTNFFRISRCPSIAASTCIWQTKACRIVPKAIFERFTKKAVKAILLSQEDARRLGHKFFWNRTNIVGSYWWRHWYYC